MSAFIFPYITILLYLGQTLYDTCIFTWNVLNYLCRTIYVVHRHFLFVIILIAVGNPAFIIMCKEIFVHSFKLFHPSLIGGYYTKKSQSPKNLRTARECTTCTGILLIPIILLLRETMFLSLLRKDSKIVELDNQGFYNVIPFFALMPYAILCQ